MAEKKMRRKRAKRGFAGSHWLGKLDRAETRREDPGDERSGEALWGISGTRGAELIRGASAPLKNAY